MAPKFIKTSRYFLMAVLLLLVLQYILGMVANIYALPPYGPSNIGAHYVFGYVVALVGLIVIIFVAFTRNVGAISFSVLGFISIVLAGESGRGFAFLSQHNGVYSLAMALFWLLSFSSYFISLYLIPTSPQMTHTINKGEGLP